MPTIPFDIVKVSNPEDPDYPYFVSRTGLVYHHESKPPIVLSFVNGSMCINVLGMPIEASQFDEFAFDVLRTNEYFLPHYPEEAIAQFDTDLGFYVA